MTGLINHEAEIQRLQSDMDALENDAQRILNKLNNNGFMAKAPAAFVEKERLKLEKVEASKADIKQQIAELTTQEV